MKKAALALTALAVSTIALPAVGSADTSLRLNVQYFDDGPPPPPRGWDRDRPGPHGPSGRDWGERRGRDDIMGPRRIARTLERRGYSVGDIRLDGDTYFVRATRPSGRRAVVMVDAYTGRIIGERRVGGPRY